ncbi:MULTISPECIES: nucleotide disphospho-sugar-binding domain-containing protein [Micromonospora]|uniref:nucleotide disphospho-sugar-binding domain-containing protein n=1 Tax=Micromonospora TaxID=1873 RepID=UPI0033C80B1E
MVPLAWALRSSGAQVLVATPASFADEVTTAGLPTAANCGPLDMIETMRPDPGSGTPRQAATAVEVRRNTGRGFAKLAALALPGTVELARSWGPDVVIAESMALAAPVVASMLGVPFVEHRWGLAVRPELAAVARDEMSAVTGALPPMPAVEVLDVCPPSFQLPGAPSSFAFAYVPYNGPATVPAWTREPRRRPRVCLTLGTVLPRYGRVTPLMDLLLKALVQLDVEVVVAMREQDRQRLESIDLLPVEVRTAAWLPLNAVLPACDAVVHHGGSGTTMTSLVHGLPQVALPHFADQFVNAGRITTTGTGVALSPEEADADAVASAVSTVLADDRFRAAAAAVRSEIARLPTPAATVDVVRRVADSVPA